MQAIFRNPFLDEGEEQKPLETSPILPKRKKVPPLEADSKEKVKTTPPAPPPRSNKSVEDSVQKRATARENIFRRLARMDRFDVIKFEDLSGPKGGEWVRIGGGSFGVVFRGEYLGTEVAIKEVLPNNTYDVEKYFERECVLMKEARHPNIVQYIGLTKSPGQDGRIYIVSEFVGPNVRQQIADKKKPFDWPLRISYATDIARAVAYLHARNCMHRDLKGENLLITDNQRIKVCDFGFARIAARNEEEMRRISYCGTDGYMSPEILMGVDFSLPSDIFSLGIIFCEIISRHLVDPNTFKRLLPSFGVDVDEIKEMASDGCPSDFIQLCIDMTKVEPEERPDMRQVIRRLRFIEQEIVSREHAKGTLNNVGSLRGSSLAAVLGSKSNKNKTNARRLPSFDGQVSTSQVNKIRQQTPIQEESHGRSSSESSDEDVEEALRALEKMTIGQKDGSRMVAETIEAAGTYKVAGHGNPWWDETDNETVPAASWMQHIPSASNTSTWKNLDVSKNDTQKASNISKQEEEYSTSVVRPSRQVVHPSLASSLSKMTGNATLRDAEGVMGSTATVRHRAPLGPLRDNNATEKGSSYSHAKREISEAETLKPAVELRNEGDDTTQSYMTAHSSDHNHGDHHHAADPSLAMATIASTIYETNAMYHRFTLVKNGTRKPSELVPPSANLPNSSKLPYQLILANALTKCNVCSKRLGFGAYMDCDDCPYKTHVGCAAMAEPNCQELNIPGANGSASGSPLALSPKRQDSLEVIDEDATTAQQTKQTGESIARTSSPAIKASMTKSPPSSLSKGVAFLRKRHSKSPPPKSPSPPSVVRV